MTDAERIERMKLLERMAATGSAQNFLKCSDEVKAQYFALCIDESSRRKAAEINAERYLWLRGDLPTNPAYLTQWGRSNRLPHISQHPRTDTDPEFPWVFKTGAECGINGDALDAAIDLAMQPSSGGA